MKDPLSVILSLQVTEKGAVLAEHGNKYMLRVAPQANKVEIRSAIERQFGVSVLSVNTCNYSGKRKRERTAKYGKRSDWKRAIVTLKQGDTIDLT
ncbi:MAG: 50S ribosomal protein L23 [Verrucomicrobiota bacterium]